MINKNDAGVSISPEVYTQALPESREQCLDIAVTLWSAVDTACSARAWCLGRTIAGLLERGETGVYTELSARTGLKRRTLQLYKQIYAAFPDKAIEAALRDGITYAQLKQAASIQDAETRKALLDKAQAAGSEAFVKRLDKAVRADRESRSDDGRVKPVSTEKLVNRPAPVAAPPPRVETASIDRSASMAYLLKTDAPVPDMLEALHMSVSAAVRAAEVHANNLHLVVEKAADTVRTPEDAYKASWRTATVLINDLDELQAHVDEMKQLLIDGIPDPGTVVEK